MTTIDGQSASKYIAAAAENARPKPEGKEPSPETAAPKNASAGDAVSEALVQSARYRLMREANTLSAESAVADAAMARELTASVRDLILAGNADSVRIQSAALPHDALRLLD